MMISMIKSIPAHLRTISLSSMSRYPTPRVHVAVIGVGLVGSELIHQLLSLPPTSPFNLISLTSSSRTLFNPSVPLSPTTWKSALAAGAPTKVAVVDNTSSEDVAAMYPHFLKAGINVITPNKKAYSGDVTLYNSILQASQESGAKFLHEATVGAGLPIISTLKELVATGDKVVKIEGVFSGTMSYIFNNFSTGAASGPEFSSVVRTAREKGYTEPHPGDDLNGHDVARKLTILSRLISPPSSPSVGLPPLQSFTSVDITSLVPAPLVGIPTGDAFMERLPEFDAHFAQMREKASKDGKVIRFVGVVDVAAGAVTAGLESYSTSHAFATSLGGSDNIVMFHTERYGARPLIVQGAGAGAAVTAMGVLGDLFKLV
ncbi:aspartate kinase homoserine dehydrogenase [Infundibulicybe gibba]|nr:aspartate kinase homoserine dehydrogenase [Infundibulicybe gibba]